ncbi:MAG: glycosyltransferase family 39 protein [Proteobacteria bacterium]|nr:glycosyltransferase family 39 protein [Pseudomonadota bacterium]
MEKVGNRFIEQNRYLILIIIVWLIFFVLPIGNRGLWDPDEPRYLQVSWEMATSHHYAIPQINAKPYTHKPPLFFWLSIMTSRLTGFETASRWVTALASLGTILLTFFACRKYFSSQTGFTAALILMTSGLYTLLMYTGNLDILLTFFVTLSVYAFMEWESRKKTSFLLISYISCGLGILTKGPVALLIPWITFLVWTVLKYYKKEAPDYGHLIWGPVLSLAVVLLWLVPAGISGGKEYIDEIVFRQNVGRTVNSFAHKRPWHYFLVNFPLCALPWTFMIPAAVSHFKLKEKNKLFSLSLIWFAVVLIFFSLMSGKRERYVLPAFPAFSMIIAYLFSASQNRKLTTGFFYFTAAFTYLALFIVTLFPFVLPEFVEKFKDLAVLSDHGTQTQRYVLLCIALPLAVISLIVTFRELKRKNFFLVCAGIAAGMFLVAGIGQIYYIPAIDFVKSAKHASSRIEALIQPEDTVAFYKRRLDSAWNFYLNRQHIPVIDDTDLKGHEKEYDVVICQVKAKKKVQHLIQKFSGMNYRLNEIAPIGSKKCLIFIRKGNPT